MSSTDKSEKTEKKRPKYRVISHGNVSSKSKKIRELTVILNNWSLFTENRENLILDKKFSSAMIGSAYTQSSSVLTLRQLFGIWRRGRAIHNAFYDEEGETINSPLYMVGMGGSVLSGAFVFWGIVPSLGLIVISNISPEPWKCKVPSNILLYNEAAKE
jgi:hypothetical protein